MEKGVIQKFMEIAYSKKIMHLFKKICTKINLSLISIFHKNVCMSSCVCMSKNGVKGEVKKNQGREQRQLQSES